MTDSTYAGLRACQFPTVLNTSDADFMRDFFVPALSHATRYDRGVGFFSAAWLRLAAEGMADFASRGGRARWVTSPILSSSDWSAMQYGEAARHDDLLRQALERNIDELEQTLKQDTLSALAWLIADGILEFKLALPRNKLSGGEFHDKFGIFYDSEGNSISFNGSYNESEQGTRNYESIKIFASWNEAFAPLVDDDTRRFNRLWHNEDTNVQVYDLPDAARARILKLRTHDRPYESPLQEHITIDSNAQKTLWEHQSQAITAWENNHRQGVLSMATGSGKTLTAIHAASRCPDLQLLIIAVPRANLVLQWQEEITREGTFSNPVLVYENRGDWQEKLFNRLLASRHSNQPVAIIGTMASLSRDAFNSVIEDVGIPDKTLLIVDEVHNIGAPSYRRIMRQDIQWRLGLSATPKRHFDEVGTDAVYDYFNQVVYTYDLAQALKDKRLSPYIYDVYPAYMSDEEYEQYQALTVRIVRMRSKQNSDVTYQTDNMLDGDDKDIERLLFERARIIKKCAEKNTLIEDILNQYPPTKCLVYCADHEQLKVISDGFNDRNIIHLSYTSHQPNKERKDTLNALANGVTSILLAIDCLDEGVDVPSVNQAVILASSTNMRQFIQRRGRILRRSAHKNRATLVDVIVLPPKSLGHEGKHMLFGELARAKEMARLAENDVLVLNKIATLIQPYGILFSEFITGESYE